MASHSLGSGFEGFEKRLELRFSGDDPLGLRSLPLSALDDILSAVQCSIVSAAANAFFDSYILSESSLFVYPHKIIIKTCGTTQLLKSIPTLLPLTAPLGLRLRSCRYSRGTFIFPEAQPFPHSDFQDEVTFLEQSLHLDLLPFRKQSVLAPKGASHAWHMYSASSSDCSNYRQLTVEVCMMQLDRELARQFYRRKADSEKSGDEVGREMSRSTGIAAINPRSLVCGFTFDPCGYSMNSFDRDCYSTVHVTPEDGYSYASFECVGEQWAVVADAMARAVGVFRPGMVSVSVCGGDDQCGERVWSAVARAIEPMGLSCDGRAAEEFPGAGVVTYQTFTACRK